MTKRHTMKINWYTRKTKWCIMKVKRSISWNNKQPKLTRLKRNNRLSIIRPAITLVNSVTKKNRTSHYKEEQPYNYLQGVYISQTRDGPSEAHLIYARKGVFKIYHPVHCLILSQTR